MNALLLALGIGAIIAIAIADLAQRNKGTVLEQLQRTMVSYCIIAVLGLLIAFSQTGNLFWIGLAIAAIAAIISVRRQMALRSLAKHRQDNPDRPTGAIDRPHDYWRDRGY